MRTIDNLRWLSAWVERELAAALLRPGDWRLPLLFDLRRWLQAERIRGALS